MGYDFAVRLREFQGQCDVVFQNAFQQGKPYELAIGYGRENGFGSEDPDAHFTVYSRRRFDNQTAVCERKHRP